MRKKSKIASIIVVAIFLMAILVLFVTNRNGENKKDQAEAERDPYSFLCIFITQVSPDTVTGVCQSERYDKENHFKAYMSTLDKLSQYYDLGTGKLSIDIPDKGKQMYTVILRKTDVPETSWRNVGDVRLTVYKKQEPLVDYLDGIFGNRVILLNEM